MQTPQSGMEVPERVRRHYAVLHFLSHQRTYSPVCTLVRAAPVMSRGGALTLIARHVRDRIAARNDAALFPRVFRLLLVRLPSLPFASRGAHIDRASEFYGCQIAALDRVPDRLSCAIFFLRRFSDGG